MASRPGQHVAVQERARSVDVSCGAIGIVAEFGAAQAVAGGIMIEGLAPFATVLERLAEREMEVISVLRLGGTLERIAHRGEIAIGEANRLEISETPPCIAERVRLVDRGSIGGDTLLLPTDRLEHMPKADPQLGLIGMDGEDPVVGRDCLAVATGPDQDRCFQCEMAKFLGFVRD